MPAEFLFLPLGTLPHGVWPRFGIDIVKELEKRGSRQCRFMAIDVMAISAHGEVWENLVGGDWNMTGL